MEGIKSRTNLIAESSEILQNTQKMGTRIRNFKYSLTSDLNRDQEFIANHLATFINKVKYLIEEARRKHNFPNGSRI